MIFESHTHTHYILIIYLQQPRFSEYVEKHERTLRVDTPYSTVCRIPTAIYCLLETHTHAHIIQCAGTVEGPEISKGSCQGECALMCLVLQSTYRTCSKYR